MSEAVVKSELEGSTFIVTIDRPKALNALDASVIAALTETFSAVPAEARAVVLTGAGEKAFVAGADIKAMLDMGAVEAERFSAQGHRLGKIMEELPVPIIAAVNGFALGGGCEMMLACDFAIASENARFGFPEVGLGVVPGFGGTTRLTRRIGNGMARQLLFTGSHVKAEEALRLGLVNEVVPLAGLMDRAKEIAAQIAKNAPLAVAYAKRCARIGEECNLDTANAYEVGTFGLLFSTADQKEGMAAFSEKRAPEWKGS